MKISPLNSINNCSHFKATNKQTNPVTTSESKAERTGALVALGVLGIASIALYALNTKNTNAVKKAAKPTVQKVKTNFSKKVPSKKRGKEAFRQYQYELNLRKLESLHARILNNEFDGKPHQAMAKIQRNHIQLAKSVGCLNV